MITKINASALEALIQLTKSPGWWGTSYERRHAAILKTRLNRGQITSDKAAEVLQKLGWTKETETWIKND